MKTLYMNRSAFSFVELLVVMAIVGILATMAIPGFTAYINKTKSGVAASELRTIEKAITSYALDKQAMPATLADAGFTQLDPWKRAYVYTPAPLLDDIAAQKLNTDYDLYSTGANGLTDTTPDPAKTDDDIVRSNNGNFAGSRKGL